MAIALFFVGAVCLATAWAFSNPIGAAHDEMDNHVKAVASARGEWIGSRSEGTHTTMHGSFLSALESSSLDRMTADFHLPASVAIPGFYGCVADRTSPATCQQQLAKDPRSAAWYAPPAQPRGYLSTEEGYYLPVVYALQGMFGSWFTSFTASAYAIRVTGGLICGLLWTGAAWLALDRSCSEADSGSNSEAASRRRLLGVMAAMSPMAFFLATTESPNGIEIGAAACFCAGLLRVTADNPRRSHWVLTAAAGAIFALSRQFDPFYLAAISPSVSRSSAVMT